MIGVAAPADNENLATCNANLAAAQEFPATGQTTCWNSAGVVIPCAGTGHDGDIQAGATLSYTDTGNGTIIDNNTKLEWEKKSGPADPSIHSVSVVYTWDNAFAVHVATLNGLGGTMPCFAGRCDWRVPNVKELQSIVNYEKFGPAVSEAFDNGDCTATSMCTVTQCSCTETPPASDYWSSSSIASQPRLAWGVSFFMGVVGSGSKIGTSHVRAVRGGSNVGPQ